MAKLNKRFDAPWTGSTLFSFWRNADTSISEDVHVSSIADGADANAGTTTDAAITSDADGTLSGKLRGLVKWAYERMPASLGQKAMTASLPVAIASDQDAIAVDATGQGDVPVTLDGEAVVLGAGAASIGTLGTNTGVDIGDVDVTSVVPGVSATSLGKAIDSVVGATDTGVASLNRYDAEPLPHSHTDGDYCVPSVTALGEQRTRDQRVLDIQNCNDYTEWSVLGNDTDNLADSIKHTFGVGAITFDKVDGLAGTVYAGVESTIPTIDISHLFEAGGFIGMTLYLSSITEVIAAYVRLGTDSSNYQEWTWPADALLGGEWNDLRMDAGIPNYVGCLGSGWDQTAITYVSVVVEFSAEDKELTGIVLDHVHVVGGRVTSTQLLATVKVTKVNLNKVAGSKLGLTGNGSVAAGTQRVTLADDSTGVVGLSAGVALVGKVSAGQDTTSLYSGATALTPKFAVISGTASGDNTLVAAVVGKKIRVLAYHLVCAAEVAIRFESGASGTALTGVETYTAKEGVSNDYCPLGLFETAAGALLNLELGGAVQVSGSLTYVEV